MTAASAPVTLAPRSAAQQKASLWSDERQQIYAVVMGSRIPDLPGRLLTADLHDHDCLLPGALEPEQRLPAPYLLHLKQDAAFTDWLLFEASAALGDWGVLVRSSARLTALRNHLRSHGNAMLPDGTEIALDWMDRETLLALIEHSDVPQLEQLFGPASLFVLAGSHSWRHASFAIGDGLQQQDIPLARAV